MIGLAVAVVLAGALASPAQVPAIDAPVESSPATAAVAPAQRAKDEAQARQALETVRAAQQALTAAQETGRGAQAEAQRAMHAADVDLATASRQAHEVAQRLAMLDRELESLTRQRTSLEQRLAAQREVIGALLRSAHALGRHQDLKLVLGFEQGAGMARLLAYHRVIERDRSARLRAVARDLATLAGVRRSMLANRERWTVASLKQGAAVQARTRARGARQRVLDNIASAQGQRAARLLALRSDERQLVELLKRLADAIADIPKMLDDAQPLTTLKGKLPWPAPGKVLSAFGTATGAGEARAGVLIAAPAGSEIGAVAHGRVAYADWLKGYGLVLIVDHGDGFITLYAHNEALLKDVGDWVTRGEALATAGASGGRSETGVYFELRRNGQPQNPAQWLSRRAR